MGDNEKIPPVLHTALNLDGSSDSIKNFYAEWANSYDKDTRGIGYCAVDHVVALLAGRPVSEYLDIDTKNRNLKIMDAGCGTGTLGKTLTNLGYSEIDGFDISEDMVNFATTTGAYQQLTANSDINDPVNKDWIRKYDCTISIGVFTPGHVPPQALSQLIKMTRRGGMIIVSTRIAYYESENFQAIADSLENSGEIKLLYALKDTSYTQDENAHYWVYAAL